MLILLFVIFVTLFILTSIFIDEYKHDFFKFFLKSCTITGAIITIVAFISIGYDFSKTIVIDDMIDMYIEENQNIENQIDVIVSKYMDYESGTFSEFKADSSITLVSLYPELKSDELVQTQIATYQSNNAKLKELKAAKINARVYKWWLYFGK